MTSNLAGMTDRYVRALYDRGDEKARLELIKRGLIHCPRMEVEAARAKRSILAQRIQQD